MASARQLLERLPAERGSRGVSAVVKDPGVWQEPGLHSLGGCAESQAEILAEQEGPLVERAQPAQRVAASENCTAHGPADPPGAAGTPRGEPSAQGPRRRGRWDHRPHQVGR